MRFVPLPAWFSSSDSIDQHRFDLVRSVIRKLHVNAEVFALQTGNHCLQRVAVLAGDAHDVTLNRSLDLGLRIFDELHNFFRLLLRNALLNLHVLSDGAARRRLDGSIAQEPSAARRDAPASAAECRSCFAAWFRLRQSGPTRLLPEPRWRELPLKSNRCRTSLMV